MYIIVYHHAVCLATELHGNHGANAYMVTIMVTTLHEYI